MVQLNSGTSSDYILTQTPGMSIHTKPHLLAAVATPTRSCPADSQAAPLYRDVSLYAMN